MEQQNEIVLYQPDELTKLEVRVENETVWLTQAQMAELFQRAPQNITMHIRNIYAEGELSTESTCKDFLQVQKEGNREVKRSVRVYNLDVIISVFLFAPLCFRRKECSTRGRSLMRMPLLRIWLSLL